jgi:hypothetical protein
MQVARELAGALCGSLDEWHGNGAEPECQLLDRGGDAQQERFVVVTRDHLVYRTRTSW